MVHAKVRWGVAWLAALMMWVASGTSRAAETSALPVHVLSVKSDAALDQAEALTQALRKGVRDAPGWALGGSRQSLEFLVLKMGCEEPIDASCQKKIAEVLEAERYLYGTIGFEGEAQETVVGSLHYYVQGEPTRSVDLHYSANLTDPMADALIELARGKVEEIVGGPPKGTLRVRTGGVAGELLIDGESKGEIAASGGSYQVASGDHRVLVKSPGYADAAGTVTVEPASTAELDLALVELEDESSVDGRLIGGAAALGVGIAAGSVGLWALLEVDSIENDDRYDAYVHMVPLGENVCEHAGTPEPEGSPEVFNLKRDVVELCDKASSMEITQAVMFPIAGVAAGVGAYLLGTSSLAGGDEEGDTALMVEPILTPEVQAMSVRYRF